MFLDVPERNRADFKATTRLRETGTLIDGGKAKRWVKTLSETPET